MEISPAGSSSSAPIQAQVKLQKSTSTQKEAVVSTLLAGAADSTVQSEVTGKKLLTVA